MKKPKLLFVYNLNPNTPWMDGLWAALNLLEKDFNIHRLNLAVRSIDDIDSDYDFILGWGGFNSPVDMWLKDRPEKKGLCVAGNAYPAHSGYDLLFYETKWVRDTLDLKTYSDNLVHAFGINADLYFQIDMPMPIVWDYIGVGSLSNWKRWEKMVGKDGIKLVVGEYQEDNPVESGAIANHLLSHNVMVSPMVNPYDLANLYNWSRTCYIPADTLGGGERAVLEARACGLDVEVEDDNPKLQELLKSDIWDHHYYAKQLKKGIKAVL